MSLILLRPPVISPVLEEMLTAIREGAPGLSEISYPEAGRLPSKARVIFALAPDSLGQDLEFLAWLKRSYPQLDDGFSQVVGGVVVAAGGEEFSKAIATQAIWLLNSRGCAFVGHPLVKYISGYRNFATWEKATGKTGREICHEQCCTLGQRLAGYQAPSNGKNIVALYASQRTQSNTFELWQMVREHIAGKSVEEVHINNGIMQDCRGCSFTGCMHYAQQQGCFYGGMVVSEVYPAVERADDLIFICPNYNDAISANMMAVINRLTALYRTYSFHDKRLWGVIVSGNSGGDLVGRQLLGALCLNKGFFLPPRFALLATANHPGSIHQLPGIHQLAAEFARRIAE